MLFLASSMLVTMDRKPNLREVPKGAPLGLAPALLAK
jgi:hypothetical protein